MRRPFLPITPASGSMPMRYNLAVVYFGNVYPLGSMEAQNPEQAFRIIGFSATQAEEFAKDLGALPSFQRKEWHSDTMPTGKLEKFGNNSQIQITEDREIKNLVDLEIMVLPTLSKDE
ncbi:MAG: hypothetical protein A3C50_00815 [Candidatus Staskawiczbacteria bacterium RIFCSPHIGHO2_02_FULL_43_16]|uniref:Uncharacterized protein n=1 Tax=Candidatus Staskawiczbacteria bacterium RIFCSPHIGHO2_01_FULL_41_41 TaxID=1802203 RepID=A0A1G2HU01_9BACT|nr:MAG: hypothetical protein A2822_00075 [Candidatus Staskawiczbacteria bacterium RIFCSPHIGHO2_01_FULL_41_41]OGZ68296.1 MAG: hypothetical protein A3C50_00815 [Candidatus Staskawiczbacteria bacterium RIFCSPHIGHO2_02_FULL_43_16]OGZ74685.1 MAG: hypothetical protein A3A12_00905 [Candidatus Staskawiczbacteria bacterium RIFCSPLOWO2_01_FULL_43_17b]